MEDKTRKKIKEMIDDAKNTIVITNKGAAVVGSKNDIETMIVMGLKEMIDDEVLTFEDIDNIVKLTKMSYKELEKEALNKISELFKSLMGD